MKVSESAVLSENDGIETLLNCSIVKSRLTSVKQTFTKRKSVKTIQQSYDLIGLESYYQLKKLTDLNAHNTIKRKYFESAILKYAIYRNLNQSFLFTWVHYEVNPSTTG